MGEDRLQSTLHSMRDDWDRRARENARYFVATHRSDWTDEDFFASGEQELYHSILTDMGNVSQGQDPATMRVLEIGCGAGRVTRALARVFG
jgi:2-polyprenyl-3-methyl-5-hydroxy-6-metoxy-1,4-benzoquinol methylase